MIYVLIFIQCLDMECKTEQVAVFKSLNECQVENSKYLVKGTCVKANVVE
jgi:hypothetical protein